MFRICVLLSIGVCVYVGLFVVIHLVLFSKKQYKNKNKAY